MSVNKDSLYISVHTPGCYIPERQQYQHSQQRGYKYTHRSLIYYDIVELGYCEYLCRTSVLCSGKRVRVPYCYISHLVRVHEHSAAAIQSTDSHYEKYSYQSMQYVSPLVLVHFLFLFTMQNY